MKTHALELNKKINTGRLPFELKGAKAWLAWLFEVAVLLLLVLALPYALVQVLIITAQGLVSGSDYLQTLWKVEPVTTGMLWFALGGWGVLLLLGLLIYSIAKDVDDSTGY